MIKSSTHVELPQDGELYQWITFSVTTVPTSATIYWQVEQKDKEGNPLDPKVLTKTVAVTPTPSEGFYELTTTVPSKSYIVKLDTEQKPMSYESQWEDGNKSDDAVPLAMRGTVAIVPYCDLTKLGLRYYDKDMNTLYVWDQFSPMSISTNSSDGYIDESSYGEPTLVVAVETMGAWGKIGNDGDWFQMQYLDSGYYVELVNHSPIITDPVANRTITRESLYDDKTYRAKVEP